MKGKLSIFKTALIFGAMLVLLLSVASCSNKSGGSSDEGGGGSGGGVISTATITVLANPSNITVNGTSTITATVRDIDGSLVPDGTPVVFSLNVSTYGSLSNSNVTTASGVATTTFTAGSTIGTVTITATSIGVSSAQTLIIGTVPGGAAATGSIQFVSATPQVIGIKGAGQVETSTILFLVNDLNGNPVDGASVNFTMTGPNGGEYMGDIDSTPNSATALSVNGNVSVILHSGSIAGTVTVVGTTLIAGVPISTSSTPLSIGGGVASATHFTLARTIINLEGLGWANLQSIVSAYLADRFGNYNVLNGTAVSFYTEAGAIDAQGITREKNGTYIDEEEGDTGAANVVFRTQHPMPEDVTPAVAGDALSMRYFNGLNEPFFTAGTHTYNPRDGWVTALAATKGEEKFLDENIDGLFTRSYKDDKCPYSNDVICECDGGVAGGYAGYILQGEKCTDPGKPGGIRSEGFVDLPEDPFYDVNDDGLRDDGQTNGHPFELFIDTYQNGIFDSTNGKWDGPDCQTIGCNRSKTIWEDTKMVFSGGPRFLPEPDGNNCYNLAPTCNATYANGLFAGSVTSVLTGTVPTGSGSFRVIVGDRNLNALQGGTTITVTATISDIGTVPPVFIVPDGLSLGPTVYDFSVTGIIAPGTVTVEVATPNKTKDWTTITVPLI